MVGEAIGVHKSTVSRATAHKFIQTPRGLFEMKYFFTAAIASSAPGVAHSAEAVRQRIRQMIDDESPAEVLADDVIVERLRRADIVVARRTVAKYRDSLRIPSSVETRKMKMAAAAPPRRTQQFPGDRGLMLILLAKELFAEHPERGEFSCAGRGQTRLGQAGAVLSSTTRMI